MPTPTQHAASAQTFTDWYTDPSKQASVTDDAQTLAAAHAHLAASAGTGTAYTNADALTVEAESLRANGLNYRSAANRALLYAIRATR